jgi:hypothetical protein
MPCVSVSTTGLYVPLEYCENLSPGHRTRRVQDRVAKIDLDPPLLRAATDESIDWLREQGA